MIKYTLQENGSVTNNATGASGITPGIYQWNDYQQWLAEGNTPIPVQPSPYHNLINDVWVPDLLAAQTDMWERIKAERDRRSSEGFLEPISGKWFHSDDKSRTQHLGMVIMGASLPADINWKTMDGSFVLMTPTLAGDIFSAEAASDQAIFAAAEAHKAAMLLAPDPVAYDYSTGWPLAYGE